MWPNKLPTSTGLSPTHLTSFLSGRERGERDSRHAQRDGNEDQRGVHDVRQLEPEHRPGLYTGGHAHVLQHQDILGHQVGHEYVGSEHNLAERKISTMKFFPTTFLRKCAIVCSPKSMSAVPLGDGEKSANIPIFAQDSFSTVGHDEGTEHYVRERSLVQAPRRQLS